MEVREEGCRRTTDHTTIWSCECAMRARAAGEAGKEVKAMQEDAEDFPPAAMVKRRRGGESGEKLKQVV